MLNIFTKHNGRVSIDGLNIYINNQNKYIGTSVEIETVFMFDQAAPYIKVYEDQVQLRSFNVETLQNNPDLKGQFFHCSIRVFENSAVMIDGIISKNRKTFPKWTDDNYEAIRLQPFYLTDANDNNLHLVGKGLFERGLHFNGRVTPTTVRNICICDSCTQSFTIQHFHAGFSELQYFYSASSKTTLVVPYNSIENLPIHLQENIDIVALENIENRLPLPSSKDGIFKYYNSFQCPHCFSPYIDFEKNRASRPKEYYGNFYINNKPQMWDIR